MMKIYKKLKMSNGIKAMALGLSLFSLGSSTAQITYTFTNASATGVAGPTQGQVNTAYASTNLNGSVTVNAGIQNFTVPVTGMYRIEAIGASGASVSIACNKNGGLGARMAGDFSLTAGTVLKILVGQMGSTQGEDGGGGGGSFVTNLSNSPYVVAGGGGGASNNIQLCGSGVLNGLNATITMTATSSGDNLVAGGANGNGGGSSGGSGRGGGGLLTNAVGSGGIGIAFVNGGAGGTGNNNNHGGFGGGGCGWFNGGNGGGGGGYSGGGTSSAQPFTGGGGGASFNGGTNQTNTAGFNSGHGLVKITQLYSAVITQSAAITCFSLCNAVLTGSVNGGTGPYTYTWLPSNSNSTVQSNLCAGVYTLTVMDSFSQTATTTYTVIQPALLSPSVTAVTNASCFGSSNGAATVTPFGGTGPYTYSWVPTANTTSAVSSLTAGVYTCQVKDANLCSATVTATITQPAAIGGSATSSAVCNGGTVALNGSGATSYSWTGSVVNGVAFTPTAGGSYTVVGSNSVTGCTGTAVVSIGVGTTPTVSIANRTVCAGQSTTLTPSGAATYSFSGGSAVVSPSATTVYTVTGTSSVGCVSAPVTVTVQVIVCTGINANRIENVKVSIYPNPSNGLFTIESNTSEVKNIIVTDVNGKLIEKLNTQSQTQTLDIRKYDDGVYFIKVGTLYGDKTMKVIKSK